MPFTAKTFGTLYQQINRASFTLPPELHVPRGVTKLIVRCLKKDPAERVQSAAELLSEVRQASAPGKAETTARSFALLAQTVRKPLLLLQPSSTRRLLLLAMLVAVLYVAWHPPDVWFRSANHSIRIDPADGPAELYVNGSLQGTTPLDLPARIGEPLRFRLQRGNLSKDKNFIVTSNMKVWSEPLQTGF